MGLLTIYGSTECTINKQTKQIYKLISHCSSSFQVNNMLSDKKITNNRFHVKEVRANITHFFTRNIALYCSVFRSMTMKSSKRLFQNIGKTVILHTATKLLYLHMH